MAALIALRPESEIDFTALRSLLDLTDGNLGAHLLTLEAAGYVRVEKRFINRKPRTSLRATGKGRARFQDHVEALRAIIHGGDQAES